jgi:hypothetical protein
MKEIIDEVFGKISEEIEKAKKEPKDRSERKKDS